MNKRKMGTVLVMLGVVLLCVALLFLIYNTYIEKKAYQESKGVLHALQYELSKNEPAEDSEKTTISVNGYEYVGYIEVPKIGISLPVLSIWDYARLKIAPCRQFGAPETGDLVIAAHNYKSFFGQIADLSIGDAVTFVDVNNRVHSYTVAKTGIVQPEEVEKVKNSGYDLVLYTCSYGGKSRIAVFCNKETL